ncbi:divergent polysaccharide deacetylase family protein [Campylobacter sp. VicNov18]|uniref:divergent polysaccharide deacetylase family protein n=1 Tax=Campylobacter bilis TaxID=2691918 RepID=UPI00130EFDC0|nr:divergent polysaccharide deacetylase family protein [Campylobacter bilis]MPV63431.1 divergent polysaccharide deacetylase family protein [Campylobacter hepaticus]MBM0636930.1 divergent polysaccharide deacetylase family protein [Campylobacter bilis]MCC8277642.1 divergent polysaccharide deacetylase family protein [Campylobacter bilis]MCC8299251.1 divergent polysaccharide deacetylase family protein [Campylobacter bilis]MCC8300551.1 divergent polysaccharide deacetylase family protein [Campylobac
MSKKRFVLIERYLIIIILVLACIALILGILIQKQNSQNVYFKPDFIDTIQKEKQENLNFLNTYENEVDNFLYKENQSFDNNASVSVLEQRIQDFNLSFEEQNLNPIVEIKQNQDLILQEQNLTNEQNAILPKNLQIARKNTLPKLAIIIDDMANASQVKRLKALDLKLNPSFFPPDKNHKNTPKLALKFDFYMVHLPLAAIDYDKAELDTLNPNDSKERIFQKIKQIKKDFKNLKYINNHTGSLFTSNEKAMRNLYEALKTQNIFFVDSKTTSNSKASKIAQDLGEVYIQRDVFLDNQDDVAYIKNQLAYAVKLAQKKGFALAIAHPRKNTFKALKQSKDLLKSVELVYLSEIYGK